MKLSEYIILGSTAFPPNDGDSWFGSGALPNDKCGCAMGRAWLAAGRTVQEWMGAINSFPDSLINGHGYGCSLATFAFGLQWPWLRNSQPVCGRISQMFNRVVKGELTIDAIAEYVRSIEPSCGECCKFNCTCHKKLPVETKEISEVPA
jgi:hypothetical protein